MKGHRIIFCSTSYFEYDRRMQRIIQTLKQEGYDITWISRSINDKQENIQGIDNQIIYTWVKHGPLFYLEFMVRLFFRLLLSRGEIISAVDLDTILPCMVVSRFKSSKFVFDAHEIFYEVPELTGKPIKKTLWKMVARLSIKHADKTYTVNQSLKKHYEEKYKHTFDVIYNVPPVASDDNISDPTTRENVIIYLGVLNKGRGLELAINAMTELTDYKLIILGKGDIGDELEKLADSLDLTSRVIFSGYVLPDEIGAHLRQAKLAINILEADSENYRLSLANKFFDYMHAGVPSINMNYPEYSRILIQHPVGVCIEKYTSQDFIHAVRSLEDESKYLTLVENCKRFKSLYAWEEESKKLTAIYNSLFITPG